MIQRMLLVILMVLGPSGLAWAGDWPQWRGPERTGVSKETGLLQSWPAGGPKLLWTFRDAGEGLAGMAVVGDCLYSLGAAGKKDYVYAIDLTTQKKLWSVEVGARCQLVGALDAASSTPTIDGPFLYAIGSKGNLVCVETASGRKVWSQGLLTNLGGMLPADSYSESPLVDGDLVIASPGGKQGAIAAFDKKTGTLKWRSPAINDSSYCAGNASMIAIEVGGVRQYVQMTWSTMVGVRASDGKLLWKVKTGSSSFCTPAYRNDSIYSSAEDICKLFKLIRQGDKFTTEQIYSNRELCSYCGGFVLVGEYVYGYCNRRGWVCQDFKTGKRVWIKNPGKAMGNGSVVFADGNLYGYHEERGDVLLIKATPAGYQEQGRFRIPGEKGFLHTYPVVANGKLYLRNRQQIFCYDIRKPQ